MPKSSLQAMNLCKLTSIENGSFGLNCIVTHHRVQWLIASRDVQVVPRCVPLPLLNWFTSSFTVKTTWGRMSTEISGTFTGSFGHFYLDQTSGLDVIQGRELLLLSPDHTESYLFDWGRIWVYLLKLFCLLICVLTTFWCSPWRLPSIRLDLCSLERIYLR